MRASYAITWKKLFQEDKIGLLLKIKILSCTVWFTDLFSCFHLEQRFEVG